LVKKLYKNSTLYGEFKCNIENFKNFAKHSHKEFNIVAIKSDSIEIEYHNQTTQTLKPKQLAIFNPNQVHLTKKSNNNAIEYYSLMLDTNWCISLQNSIYKNSNFLNILPNIIDSIDLYQDFINLYNSLQNGVNIENDLKDFATTLFRQYCQSKSENEQNSLLKKIENYILQNIQEQISIDEIAKSVGYSSAHINRLFKKEFGLTLHAFLIDKRIGKAKELITQNQQATLTQIAYEAGFYDQSHFIRNFKKAYSLSPKEYL